MAPRKGWSGLAGWTRKPDEIVKEYRFRTFTAAVEFVRQVADLAEAANHHPDILIRYNRVQLTLSTHDAGGLTFRDTKLAEEADALAGS